MITVLLDAILACFYPNFNTHAFGCDHNPPKSGGAHASIIVRDLITNAATSSQSIMDT